MGWKKPARRSIFQSSEKKTKYRNNKVYGLDGEKVADSQREYERLQTLKILERAGEIKDLQLQVKYDLIPSQKICGKTEKGVFYKADFVYWTLDGKMVCEDAKGFKTPDYIIKRKLMKLIHGIDVVEV